MAGFTNQIKTRFKALFPKVNLSAAKLDAIIARVDAKTEADDQEKIDAALNAINEYTPFEEMAREEDRIRDLESKAKKPVKKVEDTPSPDDDKPDDDVPAWAKALIESNKALTTTVQALQGEKVTTSRKDKLAELLKEADESYRDRTIKLFSRMKFDTDEEFEAYLADEKTDLEAYVQSQSDAGLGKDAPARGKSTSTTTKEASQAELDAVFENVKI